ncbi:rhodanese-related sulfurtransferase [Leisingera sp. S232]|uniref:oxygen-dependent tRNA uridine(34) hydroxylase TrhO n=1 Tax=Leisingera sp. S232 TaxID=3415132 RepID=UPI003C7CDB52
MYTIAALYHFTRFPDPAAIKPALLELCQTQDVKGSLLLAREGINGTIAGPRAGIDAVLAHIKSLPGCAALEWKEATAAEPPFGKMKVRLKKEIVTMGQPDVDPLASVGHYVEPEEWNDLIRQDDVVLIDTRNDYEVAIGTFEGAIDPETDSFRDFPAWWEKNKDRFHNKRVAMFCTGGIRCEKSTNYLLGQGVEDVYHLKGGILRYLEEMPAENSTWEGECFVFDNRVSVGHGLVEGPHELCHGCRRPILPQDKDRPEFEQGVSCHQCIDQTSAEDKARFRERQKQMMLARKRGADRLGSIPL